MDEPRAEQDHPDDAAGRLAVPAMPPPPSWGIRRVPHPIVEGRHTLGWQDARGYGHCFVVLSIGAMGGLKVHDRFPLTEEGWAAAWAALVERDADSAAAIGHFLNQQAAATAAQATGNKLLVELYEKFTSGTLTKFRSLGVQVLTDEGSVYTIGSRDEGTKTDTSKPLGPLAGAQAVVTDGSQAWSPGRAMFLPVGLTGLATKTVAHAAVIFADGSVHSTPLDGNKAVRDAQLDAVQFNALAGATSPPTPGNDSDPAARLRRLKELLEAGLVSQEEYDAKRADIIESI